MEQWQDWIGRTETRHDRVDPGLVARWCATFDRDQPRGTAPQGLHWCLCQPDAPTALLSEDGHPRRAEGPGSFLPPIPLPRRMWAGSRIAFHSPLRLDGAIERMARIESITAKSGRSGELVFVEVLNETRCDGVVAVSEVSSIVYRAAAAEAGATPPTAVPASGTPDLSGSLATRSLVPDAALLFRYSALTFNSHRIHYDYPYVTGVEGYRGLVVHGPLMASLLLDLARREWGDDALGGFAFRGVSPAIAGERLHLVLGPDGAMAVLADDGRPIMEATATR